MKKILRFISFGLVIVLLAYLTIKNFNNNQVISNAEENSDMITINVINANPEAGDVHIKYILDNEKIYAEGNSITVPTGTKVGIYFGEDGNYYLNEGYSVYCWAELGDNVINPLYKESDDGEKSYKNDEKLILTMTESKTYYIYSKTSTSHVIAFYNSYITSSRSLLGYSFAEDGKSCDTSNIIIPKQDGKDFDKWNIQTSGQSPDLSNVTNDMELYPTYSYTLWTVWRDYHSMFMKGLGVTLLLSVISVFCAMFLGMAICFLRLSDLKVLKFIAAAYVEIIRGVPLLLQLLVIYIVIGPTRIHIGSFFTTEIMSCLLALFINSGAYTAEIFRSGIQSVDKGQMEAGRALGLSKWKVLLKVVMPQGIKNSLPSLGNELVAMIKETSLAVSVDASIGELMSVRKQITASTYINLPPYIIVAIIYFCVTFSLSKLIGHFEKRLSSREF